MKKKTIYIFCLAGVLCLSVFSACRKFVQIPPSPGTITTDQLFADSVDAIAALTGIYVNVFHGPNSMNAGSGFMTLYPGMTADEMKPPFPGSDQEFSGNAITPTNQGIESIWSSCYSFIYQANACIEGVAASKVLSPSLKARVTGEAKFFRAFFHLNLTNVFGGVPLIQTTDYNVNAKLGRTAKQDVYQAIIDDLLSSDSLLKNSSLPNIASRINHFSVEALLARMYLYEGDWQKAQAYADQVINSGGYILPHALDSVFLNGSTEGILQIPTTYPGDETTEANYFLPFPGTNSAPNYLLDDYLLNAFEPGDLRKSAWTDSLSDGTTTWYYPYKYQLRNDYSSSAPPGEAYVWLRLSELYLIRAEAQAEQGNTGAALADIDLLRSRAGLAPSTAVSEADVLKAIQHERQVELFAEWGHRWIDLRRTGTMNAILGAEKSGWTASDTLFPIPYHEIQTNPFITPNP